MEDLVYARKNSRVCRINSRRAARMQRAMSEVLEQRTMLSSSVVNSDADNQTAGDGLTTLREAITAANSDAAADTITFNLGAGAHTINLSSALPSLSTDMTIQGPG